MLFRLEISLLPPLLRGDGILNNVLHGADLPDCDCTDCRCPLLPPTIPLILTTSLLVASWSTELIEVATKCILITGKA